MGLHLFINECNLVSIAMRTTELKLLNVLSEERMTARDLARAIGLGYRMTVNIVKDLLQQGYLVKTDGRVGWAPSALATAFRKISRKYDTVKLLGESRKKVLLALLGSDTVTGVQSATGLSYRTIRRAFDTLLETGAVGEKNKRYTIVDDRELQLFLATLRDEEQKRLVEPYAEVAFASPHAILKKVPLGKVARGSLTAFSVFGEYGMDLRPVFQCFVQPGRELSAEEVLVHAVVFSTSPVQLTDCAVFYAKNRNVLDLGKIRKTAKEFSVYDLIVDLENYARNLTVSSPERFLPWKEFAEKAQLYGLSPSGLLPPAAFPGFFDELAGLAGERVNVYLFGGEAMRIRGLKRATRDVDIVVENEREFIALRTALTDLGYKTLREEEISKTDQKLRPSGIFVKEGHPRVDLFLGFICNAFRLSNSMVKRCETREIRNLGLHIMSNEDIFLLKSVTDREGDIYDMIELAKSEGFDWGILFEELLVQEEIAGRHFCFSLLDSVEIVERKTGMRSPFYNRLVNHSIDYGILQSVGKWRATTLKRIREFVNYPDYKLRSRVNKLISEGKLVRLKEGEFTLPELKEPSKTQL